MARERTEEQARALRLKRWRVVRAVACPKCAAVRGKKCQRKRGGNRVSPHIERIRLCPSTTSP